MSAHPEKSAPSPSVARVDAGADRASAGTSTAAQAPASAKKERHHRRPWRDNIEAIAMAIVMAVMLKYFIVEAYQIPTGSMQPTLMGNDEAGIKDRIIVDKLSFHFRDPERFEVVVFKYPLDRSKNFIKRICGMPGEQLKISLGDLWTRPSASDEYRVVRRPLPVQREVWKRIDPKDARFSSWKPEMGVRSWVVRGRHSIEARGDGAVRLPNDAGSVMDSYKDGYPGAMGDVLGHARSASRNPVGDLRIEGEVRALPGCKSVEVELREGRVRYLFTLPGPAASETDTAFEIRTEGLAAGPTKQELSVRGAPLTGLDAKAQRLRPDNTISFAAQNMDDLLVLEFDGERQLELEIPSATDQTSCFLLRAEGEGADFSDVEVYRDIYYTEDGKKHEFDIPPGNYVMLGDNTQDSSDSRFWTWVSYPKGPEGRPVRGNWFPPQHPVYAPGEAPGRTRVFLRDEWGELYDFVVRADETPGFDPAPLVGRELIVGRAVAVFWPMSLALRIWRLQWVH